MAETTYKKWLAKWKKTELIDIIYEMHIEMMALRANLKFLQEMKE